MLAETVEFTPRAAQYRVRVSEAPRQTAGGVILAETSQHRPNEAEIVAAGPGRWVDALEARTSMQCGVGDKVIFFKHELKPAGEGEGVLEDADLIGVVDPETGDVEPLNDYVKVAQPKRVAEHGAFAVPERYRRRERRGVVLAAGPGAVVVNPRSRWFGTRTPVSAILTLSPNENLVSRTVYWDPEARIADVKQPSGEGCMFIRAGDLLAVEDE